MGSNSASIFDDVSKYGSRYDPEKYRKGSPLTERMLFSFPEYLIYDTRFGGWFSNHLVNIISWMNELMLNRIPKTTENYSHKIIKTITIISTRMLNWITYNKEKNRGTN